MVECRNYRVADHIFSISANEDYFGQLTNYDPFRVDSVSAETSKALLFSLKVEDKPVPVFQTEHFFTDVSDADMPRIEIDKYAEGWVIGVSVVRDSEICCRLYTSFDFAKATLYLISKRDVRFAIDNAAMLLFAFASVGKRTLEMHASVVVREGKGYLFLGKSGTGKSTHSRQWLEAFSDAWLLNDDNPIVRIMPSVSGTEECIMVYGSPWSGKTSCYKNEQVPIGGVVTLIQAPFNNVTKLGLPQAFANIMASVSGMKVVPEAMDSLYDTVSNLVTSIPVYALECLPNTAAAECCYKAVRS